MSIINGARLAELEANLNTQYGETLQVIKPILGQVVTPVKAQSYILNDIFMLPAPALKILMGSRNHRNISLFDGSYNNIPKLCREFESTIDIKRIDIEADNKGVYVNGGSSLARQIVRHMDKQATLALINGQTTHSQYVSADGVAVFSDAHTLNPSGNQSNLLTSSFGAAALEEAIATAQAWTNNEGEPIFVGFDEKPVVMVPPALGWAAKQLLLPGLAANLTTPGASSNVLMDQFDLIINPYLTALGGSATEWYILFPMNGIAPITHASFIDPEFVAQLDPTLPNVFERQVYSYGAYACTHSYIPCWWTCIKSTGGSGNSYTGTTIRE